MFTGIITDVGTVAAIEMRGDMRARINTAYDIAGKGLARPDSLIEAIRAAAAMAAARAAFDARVGA